ncbi:MAG: alpha/beta fold hydrolase [Pseudomonadota bacterium]
MSTRKEQLHGARPDHRPLPPGLRVMRFLFGPVGGLAPRLLGRWAYALWFSTRRFPESAAGRQAAYASLRETLMVRDIPVAVYRWGSGPAVLFMHGWSGRGSQVAAFVEPLVNAGYQVIALDAPGHGATPGTRTNVLECAEVLLALGRQHGPLHGAITHSFGGMVLAYAMNHGLAVQRVVCISAPADVDFLLESFAATLSLHPAVVRDLDRRLEARFAGDFRARISTENNVRRLAGPALIVHDELDSSVPWQQGARIAAAWPGARLLKTRGLGHGRILRDRETVRTVVDFIAGR